MNTCRSLGKQGQDEESPGDHQAVLQGNAGNRKVDVFLNCQFEKPLKHTPVHILVFREIFFSASFQNLLKPPCRENICQYTWRHSCVPLHTPD